eukprot:10313859-Ditylum_brightwellii.AAC.1
MKTAPTSPKSSNPDVKQVIILFPRPDARKLEKGQYHTNKLRTTSRRSHISSLRALCTLL